jgi:hypothetical protein
MGLRLWVLQVWLHAVIDLVNTSLNPPALLGSIKTAVESSTTTNIPSPPWACSVAVLWIRKYSDPRVITDPAAYGSSVHIFVANEKILC